MNRIAATFAFGLCLIVSNSFAEAGRCIGSANCKVCTNCSRCAHCKGGGSCGVCGGGTSSGNSGGGARSLFSESERRAGIRQRSDEKREAEEQAKKEAATQKRSAERAELASTEPAATEAGVKVYFSPGGHCTNAIVEQIGKAQTSVKVQAYRLTSLPIAKAILAAHKRGVKVSVVLDKSQQSEKYSDATFYHNQGVEVRIDRRHAIAHNKVILIDDATVITGSFNFTAAAEKSNAENVIVIEGMPTVAAAYVENFDGCHDHAVAYKAPDGTGSPVARNTEAAASGDELLQPAR